MKTRNFLFSLCLLAGLLFFASCQKEAVQAPPQTVADAQTRAATCGSSCTECRFVNGKCNCLFCNCRRYCATCGQQTYPNNQCKCGTNPGGSSGSGLHDHTCRYCATCGVNCKDLNCVCNPATVSYPIEYMDRQKFSCASGGRFQEGAYGVLESYRGERYPWPGYEVSGTKLYDENGRPSRAFEVRNRIDDLLKRFRQPVIAKIRCVGEFDNMYNGTEFWIVITGTGGMNTYYTYMNLYITNSSFLDMACDTDSNRFTVDDTNNPILRDHSNIHGCTYEVIEVTSGL